MDDPHPPPRSTPVSPGAQRVQPGLLPLPVRLRGTVEVAAVVGALGGHLVRGQGFPPKEVVTGAVEHLSQLDDVEQRHAGTSKLRGTSTAVSPVSRSSVARAAGSVTTQP